VQTGLCENDITGRVTLYVMSMRYAKNTHFSSCGQRGRVRLY